MTFKYITNKMPFKLSDNTLICDTTLKKRLDKRMLLTLARVIPSKYAYWGC